jgi:hypothetical protein
MRVINIIVILHGAVHEIDSFGVYEEQLSDDVVEMAEAKFKEKVLLVAETNEDDFEDNFGSIDAFIEDGIFVSGGCCSVCLVWSDIE